MYRDPLCERSEETSYGGCGEIGECEHPCVCGDDFLADSGPT